MSATVGGLPLRTRSSRPRSRRRAVPAAWSSSRTRATPSCASRTTRSTTNGVRRSRSVTVVEHRGGRRRRRRGLGDPSGPRRRRGPRRAPRRPAASSAPVAEDAAPLIEGTVDRAFGEPAARDGPVRLSTVLAGLPGAFGRAAAFGHGAGGLRRARRRDDVPRHLDGDPAAPRPADRLARAGRAGGRRCTLRVGQVGTPDFAGVTLEQLETDLARRLEWATRRVDLAARAATRSSCRPARSRTSWPTSTAMRARARTPRTARPSSRRRAAAPASATA